MGFALKMVVLILISYIAALFMPPAASSQEEAIMVTEAHLADMPCKYVDKRIVTDAKYMDISTALLNDTHYDKGARFESKGYINFRTVEEQILTYFMRQSKADILATLHEGDRIVITGVVTSCADSRPWIEVDSVIRAPQK